MDFEYIGKLISKNPQVSEQFLDMDPIDASEKILGKKFENAMAENFSLGLGTFSSINELKQAISKANGDTYYGISFDEFHELVSKYGFIVGYMNIYEPDVNPNNWQSVKHGDTEREAIYYHKSGLVIYINSYGFDGINRITLMGDFNYHHNFTKLSTSINGWSYSYILDKDRVPTGIVHAELDGRSNMLFHLNRLMKVSDICETLIGNTFLSLWFLTYSDERFSDRCSNATEISMGKVKNGTSGLKKIFKNYL